MAFTLKTGGDTIDRVFLISERGLRPCEPFESGVAERRLAAFVF